MSKFLILTKVLLKSSGESLVQKDKKKLPKTIAFIVLIAIAFIPMIFGFAAMAKASYEELIKINQEGLLIELVISVSNFIIFIFGFFYVLNTFYFSSDIENLLPLPLKPSIILGSKFTVVLIYEYITEIIFLLPIMIIYGVMSNIGAIYYLYLAIVFFTLPIVPLVISSIISIVIMKFIPLTKNKDVFKTVSGILGLAIGLGFNFIFQKLGSSTQNTEDMINIMMNGKNSLVGTSKTIFPNTKFAVNSMLYSGEIKGLFNIFIFLLINAVFILILLFIGEKIYFKGVIGISETSSKQRKLSKYEIKKNIKENSILRAYLIKELKILFRTPAYFMNCVVINFLFPIILFLPFLSQPDMMKELSKVRNLLNSSTLSGIVIAICFGVIMFISTSNPTASTAISREGKYIFTCKYIPISYKKQIISKVLSGVILNFIGLALLILTSSIILKPPFYLIIQITILSIIITFFTNFVGIFIDLMFPKLLWDNEQRAVKNNMNALISMILGFIILALTIGAVLLFKLNLWTAFGALTVIYGAFDLILYFLLTSVGVKLFSKIE
jgi:ABC-2 type transport system permease protein